MRKWLAVVLIALIAVPTYADRGNTWSTKAMKALELLINDLGQIGIVTTSTGGVTTSSTITSTGKSAGGTLGSDVVVNGTFTGNATGWTLGGAGGAPDWAYATNNVTHEDAGGTTALQPSTPLTITAGTVYVVTFTLSSWTAGTVTTSIGGASTTIGTGASTAVGANGTFKFIILAADTTNLKFTPTTTLVATIDTITVTAETVATPWLTVTGGSIPLDFFFGTVSSRNTFIGQSAGQYATTGAANNTCIGGLACSNLVSVNSATCVGVSCLTSLTNGLGNSCVGSNCLRVQATGIRNSCVGESCLTGAVHSNENSAVGYQAGNGNLGNYNVFLGSTTGTSFTGSGAIAIGYNAVPTASNQALIGGANANSAITSFIFGQGVTKASPGNVTWTTTGGSGADNAGSSLTIAPGASTGTASAQTNLLRNTRLATGSTAQSQPPAFVTCPAKILSNTTITVQPVATITTTTTSGGAVQVFYTVAATDGTLYDVDSGSIAVAWRNNAGTVTAGAGTAGLTVNTVGSGSLVALPTVTAATNVVTINVTPTWVTIVPTLVTGYVSFLVNGENSIACQ